MRMYLWWSLCTLYLLTCLVKVTVGDSRSLLFLCYEDVPLVEFMYLVFTHMPGESYRRRLEVFVVVFVRHLSNAS